MSVDPVVERLVHAVLQPGFAGHERPPRWLAEALERGLGGVVYFSHNIGPVEDTRRLSDRLHDLGEVLIATDEEGGIVSRLGARCGSAHLGAAVLGRVDDVEATRQVAAAIGTDLRESGIDIDLAPVTDVNSNPDNPVIGVRSFGATPELVTRHAVAYVEGVQRRGIAATAKHFPGHGDTAVDSHVGLPAVAVCAEVLRARELAPFAAVVSAGVRAVMTAHILVPAVDPLRPATLSAPVLRILRDELGFDGVIITDALDMGAIRDTVGLGEGCVQALLAGADLLGLGNPVLGADAPDTDRRVFGEARDAIRRAIREGRLPVDRLEDAAHRIDGLRQWRRTHAASGSTAPAVPELTIARRGLLRRGAVTLPDRPLRILDVRHRRNVAAGALPAVTVRALLEHFPGSAVVSAFTPRDAREGHADAAAPQPCPGLRTADVIVTGSPGQDPQEDVQRRDALRANPDALVLVMGYATGREVLDGASRVIWTFGDSLPTAAAVVESLTR